MPSGRRLLRGPETTNKTNPHLVHDCARDDNAAFGIGERVTPFRDRDPVFFRTLVLVNDVVLATNQDSRGSVELVRVSILASRNCVTSRSSGKRSDTAGTGNEK